MPELLTRLPQRLPVPSWEGDQEPVTYETDKYTLTLRVMELDDILVCGEIRYRGHIYKVQWSHTTFDGTPKGYASNGHDYGPVTLQWQRSRFFNPYAPTTYITPLCDIVKECVLHYKVNHMQHLAEGLRLARVRAQNRLASAYNDKASELIKILDEYNETLA